MQFDQVVSKVSQSQFDPDFLPILGIISESALESRRLIDALVENKTWLTGGQLAAVSSTMEILESLAEESEPIACIFMAHLWSIASELLMHHICDAIDLWISNCKSSELRQHLQILASSQTNPNLRRHFDILAKLVGS